jgi:hypothetical protein
MDIQTIKDRICSGLSKAEFVDLLNANRLPDSPVVELVDGKFKADNAQFPIFQGRNIIVRFVDGLPRISGTHALSAVKLYGGAHIWLDDQLRPHRVNSKNAPDVAVSAYTHGGAATNLNPPQIFTHGNFVGHAMTSLPMYTERLVEKEDFTPSIITALGGPPEAKRILKNDDLFAATADVDEAYQEINTSGYAIPLCLYHMHPPRKDCLYFLEKHHHVNSDMRCSCMD